MQLSSISEMSEEIVLIFALYFISTIHTPYYFLNLPIRANFIDLIDLSLYYHFRPANIILQPQPQQAEQVEDQAGQAAQVEDG